MRQAFLVSDPRSSALRALNYEPAVEKLRAGGKAGSLIRIRDIAAELGAGYASVFARVDCSREYGIELLSQGDMFAAEPRGRIIRRDSIAHPERHEVRRWDVLIAGAGTLAPTEVYGRAVIADARLAGKYVGQDTLIIRWRKPEEALSLFAYAFLASRTGLRALRSASYGTKILRIRRDILGELPIPLPGAAVVAKVAALVRRCVEQRELYLNESQIARSVIETDPDVKQAIAMSADKRRAIVWDGELPTLTARSYAYAGNALAFLRKQWSARLGDAVARERVFRGGRITRMNCSPGHGVELYSQRDVFMIRPLPQDVVKPAMHDDLLFAPDGALLVASVGQVGPLMLFGRVELSEVIPSGAVITEVILRIVPGRRYRLALYAFLSTRLGQALMGTTAFGTSIPGMRQDLLLDLPIPALSELEPKVSGHVLAALNARREALACEREAIRIVDEEVIPSWLA